MFTTPPVYAVIIRRYLFGPERWVEVQLYDRSGREMGRSSSPEDEAQDFFAGKGISLVTRAQLLRLKARPNPARYWGRAGAGILLVCDGEVLLVLRSQHVQEPGTWGIPGGSCDGEAMFGRSEGRAVDLDAARNCALTELEEELGPLPQDLDLDEQDVITYRDRGFTYTTFVMALWPERRRRLDAGIALNWENDGFAWFTIPEALALPNLHFGARYALERLGGAQTNPGASVLCPEATERERQALHWLDEYWDAKESYLDWLDKDPGSVDRAMGRMTRAVRSLKALGYPTRTRLETREHYIARVNRKHQGKHHGQA